MRDEYESYCNTETHDSLNQNGPIRERKGFCIVQLKNKRWAKLTNSSLDMPLKPDSIA